MTSHTYDVVGIGNAIVDIIGRCDDDFLVRLQAAKGSMQLVEPTRLKEIYDAMGPAVEISGGSAANTIAGVASFGGSAGFIGKIGTDEFGRIFAHDIRSQGVAFTAGPSADGSTSRSLILVTPDGERTMHTYLGVSTAFTEADLDATLIAKAGIVYLEGYLFDRPEAKAAFRRTVEIARASHRRVALTLSDGFCVDRHRAEFLDFIRSGVDVVFANESEIKSLYETSDFELAAKAAASDIPVAVLTRSAKGSVIFEGGSPTEVPVTPVETLVDTTGAGDLYASGFLFGYVRGVGVRVAGQLGSLAAAEIISHMGARPETSLKALAQQSGIAI